MITEIELRKYLLPGGVTLLAICSALLFIPDPDILIYLIPGVAIFFMSLLSATFALYALLILNCFFIGGTEGLSTLEIVYAFIFVVSVSSVFIQLLLNKRRQHWPRVFKALLLFMVWSLIATTMALINKTDIVKIIRDFSPLANYLLIFVAYHVFSRGGDRKRFLNFFIFIAFCIVMRDLEYELNKNNMINSGHILSQMFFGMAGVGYTQAVVFVASPYYLYVKNKLLRLILLAIIVTAALTILLSMTRTYWIGVLATLLVTIVYFFAINRKKRSHTMRLVGVLSIVVVTISLIMSVHWPEIGQGLDYRLMSIKFVTTGEYDYATMARLNESKAAIDKILENPLMGQGYGYELAFFGKPYMISESDGAVASTFLHNNYLYFILKTGIVGLIFFLSFIFLLSKEIFHTYQRSDDSFIAYLSLSFVLSIIYFSIISLSTSKFIDSSVSFYLAVFGGFIISYSSQKRASNK